MKEKILPPTREVVKEGGSSENTMKIAINYV